MRFYIYENWQADDKAVIHKGSCSFCNEGEGTGRGTLGNQNGVWHGPYSTQQEALTAAKKLGRARVAFCQHCLQ